MQNKHLDTGADSEVYRNGDQVIKIYNKLFESMIEGSTSDDCLAIIKQYEAETLKAKEIIESAWLESPHKIITLNTVNYQVNVKVVPQGVARMEDGMVISEGQKFLPMNNLKKIFERGPYDIMPELDELLIYDSIRRQRTYVRQMIAFATQMIGEEIDTKFTITNRNIKPVINQDLKKLDLLVTDLGVDLATDYNVLKEYRI